MSEKGTEQATELRKQKARNRGDTVRSRELLSAASLLAGTLILGVTAKQFISSWDEVYVRSLCLGIGGEAQGRVSRALLQQCVAILLPAFVPIGLILAASFVAALVAGIGQSGGVQVHGELLELRFERLNPVTNLGNIFSLRSVARMGKSLLPAAIVVGLGVKVLQQRVLPMPVMSAIRLPDTLEACFGLATRAAWVMVAWSVLDYLTEKTSWNRKLRMSKQEVRDEIKETIGNPQVKGRIRSIQTAMRRRKVKADIARASVVITNPTHYAVALEFSFESMLAPTVLVKGRNLHALKIREEAIEEGIPVVENPPLARSLYKSVDEGHSIPYELYAAVAGILAFLYRQQVEKAARERRAAEESARLRGLQLSVVSGGGM